MDADAAVTTARTNRLEALYSEHVRGAIRLAYLMTGDEQQAQDIVELALAPMPADGDAGPRRRAVLTP